MMTPVQKVISAYKDNLDYQNRPGLQSGMSTSTGEKRGKSENQYEFAKLLKKTMDQAEKHSANKHR